MRFITFVKGAENPAGPPPPPSMFAAVEQLAEELTKKGVLVHRGGLLPTAMGGRARLSKGKITVTDGPFTEAREVVGGFSIFELKSKQEAMDWTRRFLEMTLEHWPSWEGEVEVRQLWDEDPPK